MRHAAWLFTVALAAALALPGARAARAAQPSELEILTRARRAVFERPGAVHGERRVAPAGAGAPARAAAAARAAQAAFPPANVRINDTSGDSASVAQVSPAIAALGVSVFCAFTDGEGLTAPVGGVGFAWSADGGLTYTDGGAPPAPAGWTWSGSPALAADAASGFIYLAACAESAAADPAGPWQGIVTIAASFPAPGAPAWGAARVAARTAESAGLFDQPQIAADPVTHALALISVHYTALGSGIEFVSSADQGASWTAPVTLSDPLESGAVAGPRVVAMPGSPPRLTAAWLSAGSIDADRYRARTSGDGGASWSATVDVCSAFHAFGSGPPGSNRGAGTDFPALAVDASPAGPHRGRLYLAWQESVNFYGDTLYFSPPQSLAPVIEAEPNDDAAHATPFTLGATLRGALSPGDQDWFSFPGTAGQTVVLLVDSLDAALDDALRLICTDGATRLAYSEPGAGAGYGGEIVFTLSESGTYYVRLAEAAAGAGGYRVRTALHHTAPGRARDHRDLFASHSDDGMSWSAPVLITDDPPRFDDALPELAVDGNGVAYAEWLDWRDAPPGTCGGVSHTYLARSANGGDVFTSFGAVADAPTFWTSVSSNLAGNQGDHLALFANGNGVYPAWTDGRGGDPDIEGVALGLGYLATPALISLLRVDAGPATVRLTWFEEGGLSSAALERRIEPGDWRVIATLVPDGSGFLRYTDSNLPPGALIHYRLAASSAPDGPWFGAVDVRVPLVAAFALDGAWPNPVSGVPLVRFSLDSPARATLELLDTAGRRLAAREVGALGAGAHIAQLAPAERLSPGVYWLRLSQGGRVRTARAVVLN